MKNQEKLLFEKLKEEIKDIFLAENSSSNPDISQWKGLDIVYFQEHLRKKVKGNVSEKWFYTYFKSDFEKLPRIDILNLLSQYTGYQSWAEFIEKNKNIIINTEDLENLSQNEENILVSVKQNSKKKSNKIKLYIISLLSLIALVGINIGIFVFLQKKYTYEFYFFDADRSNLVKNKIEITIPKKGFSPEVYTTNNGLFVYKTRKDTLYFITTSPYYIKDTTLINLKELRNRNNRINIKLYPDNYALMLSYYSSNLSTGEIKTELINRRKRELDKLIADNATIYQVYDSDLFGMELLDKKKYIDFMTTPTTSLKNYVLISTETKDNKIISIKFKIQKDEK